MGERIYSSIYCMLAAFAFWLLVSSCYRNVRTIRKMLAALVMGILIFCASLFNVVSEGWIVAIEFGFALFMVRDRISTKIVNVLLILLSVAIIADMAQIVVLLLFNNEKPYTRVLSIGITVLLLLIGYQTKLIRKILSFSEGMTIWKKIVCLLAMLIVMLVVSFGVVMLGMTDKVSLIKLFLALALFMLMAFSTLLFMFLSEVYDHKSAQKESEIKENIIHEQKAIYNLLIEKNDDLRKFRHDIGNRLGTLHLLLEKEEYQEARTYLTRIVEENSNLTVQQNYYGNIILDTIISMVCWRAKQDNVEIKVEGELRIDKENVYELCGVFSNAIGNAVEACIAQNNCGPVEVMAKSGGAMQMILFTNPATNEMFSNISNSRSSKKDKELHGIGIRSMRESVNKLGGSLSYDYMDGKLTLTVTIT